MNISIVKTIKIRGYEMGLYFRDGEFRGLLGEGRHWFIDPLVKVEVVSQRAPFRIACRSCWLSPTSRCSWWKAR